MTFRFLFNDYFSDFSEEDRETIKTQQHVASNLLINIPVGDIRELIRQEISSLHTLNNNSQSISTTPPPQLQHHGPLFPTPQHNLSAVQSFLQSMTSTLPHKSPGMSFILPSPYTEQSYPINSSLLPPLSQKTAQDIRNRQFVEFNSLLLTLCTTLIIYCSHLVVPRRVKIFFHYNASVCRNRKNSPSSWMEAWNI